LLHRRRAPSTKPDFLLADGHIAHEQVRHENWRCRASSKRCYLLRRPRGAENARRDRRESWAVQVRFPGGRARQALRAKRPGNASRRASLFKSHPTRARRSRATAGRSTTSAAPSRRRCAACNGEWRFTYGSLVDNNFRDLPPLPPAKLAAVFQMSTDMYKSLARRGRSGKIRARRRRDERAARRRGDWGINQGRLPASLAEELSGGWTWKAQ
jgi:hypothetical protein